jgi:predicted SprT family Zn-dependent metalloprotease
MAANQNGRKLEIDNKTEWDTVALRTVFLKVINENIKFEGPLKHVIRPTVIYTRRGGYSGYAYYHSGRMTIRLPRKGQHCPHCQKGKVDLGWPRDDGKEGRMFINDRPNHAPCDQCDGTGKRRKPAELDIYKLAHLFEHELAHCRGYKHKGMCSLNGWQHATAVYYPYLEGITVGLKRQNEKPKPTSEDKQRQRYKAVLAAIERWERKRKRAMTALGKLSIKKRYYEKQLNLFKQP